MRDISASVPGHLDADRTRAHERKCQQATNFLGRDRVERFGCRRQCFRPLECKQDLLRITSASSSDSRPGANGAPFIVPKIVVPNAGGQNEEVVCQVSVLQMNEGVASGPMPVTSSSNTSTFS